jgi:hypothetical protein
MFLELYRAFSYLLRPSLSMEKCSQARYDGSASEREKERERGRERERERERETPAAQ